MAEVANAIISASTPKSVDGSLWWDSFVILFTDLENAFASTKIPSSLAQKLKNNHAWYLDSISKFRVPNDASKQALDSCEISVGSNKLSVLPALKEVALRVSSYINLDEVQSYILVHRFIHCNKLITDYKSQEFVHLILLQYYLERQCLLKCVRQILTHALYFSDESQKDIVKEEALLLIRDGLEQKLTLMLEDLLSSKHPEHMEIELASQWVEETLLEVNFVLETIFLAYYEYLCTCNGEQWRHLCLLFQGISSGSINIVRLGVSVEATNSLSDVKFKLLLILIETLDLDNLLHLVLDQVPIRQGDFVYSIVDMQAMDAVVSTFNVLETSEAAPLVLAWAVFLCLISSLPEKEENDMLVEMDHVGHVRRAFEAAPLDCLLEMLQSGILLNSDGPVAGYRSVLRTFMSSFIASYEVTDQVENKTIDIILNILCKIYHGEESLCMQFWDSASFVDGPIRSLLLSLESLFPYEITKLVRFLSALCEGSWASECVYTFLDQMIGITTLFGTHSNFLPMSTSQTVEAAHPLEVPGIEGFIIPRGTCGHILRILNEDTALVRWKYTQPGVPVLLLHLAQDIHLKRQEEIIAILDLLSRMVSFKTLLCVRLMGIDESLTLKGSWRNASVENSMQLDAVHIICSALVTLVPSVPNTVIMSMSIRILERMLMCSPSRVAELVARANIFDIVSDGSLSDLWLLSGMLARMLLIDSENNENCPLVISILDFTKQLLEVGAEDNMTTSLVIFSLQYILVTHGHWKYKVRHARWRVLLKVVEVVKKCIIVSQSSSKLGGSIRDILLTDSSIHDALTNVLCVTSQTLEGLCFSRLYEIAEIEGLQLGLCSILEVVFMMLSNLSKDTVFSLSQFYQAMLSSSTKPFPVPTAVISLISFSQFPAIQIAAARVLSKLFFLFEKALTYSPGTIFPVYDEQQIRDLGVFIRDILFEGPERNDEIFLSLLNLLSSAARSQPAFLVTIISILDTTEVLDKNSTNTAGLSTYDSLRSSMSKKANLAAILIQYVEISEDLINSNPCLLLTLLDLLKALWQGASHYDHLLKTLQNSEIFWKKLSCICQITPIKYPPTQNLKESEVQFSIYKCQCQSVVLEIMAAEIFLQRKLQESILKSQGVEKDKEKSKGLDLLESSGLLKNLLLDWCQGSVLENMIKLYSSCTYDKEVIHQAKMSASLCIVKLIGRLFDGDLCSLSIPLTERIHTISKMMSEKSAFSELVTQYTMRGYSEGKHVKTLICDDLFYHLKGEMDGRELSSGPFKELSQFLHELDIFSCKWSHTRDISIVNGPHLFDLVCLRQELGLDYWEYGDWKALKEVADSMLSHMHDANLTALLIDAKHSTLRSLSSLLFICDNNFEENRTISLSDEIPQPVIISCIDYLCKCLLETEDLLLSSLYPSVGILNFLGTQLELLSHLSRFLYKHFSLGSNNDKAFTCYLSIIKLCLSALRVLNDIRPTTNILQRTVNLFLTLLILSVEFIYHELKQRNDSNDVLGDISLSCLGLLPVLCDYAEKKEYLKSSVAAIDILLKGFLSPNSWMPILQKHLGLNLVIDKLHQSDPFSVSVILKFLLTLARIKEGAKMLQATNLFSSLKVLFTALLDNKRFLNDQEAGTVSSISNHGIKKVHTLLILGLSVLAAMHHSLGDEPSTITLASSIIPYFFLQKIQLISNYLSSPVFSLDDHLKKKPRTQNMENFLTALTETEDVLTLICTISAHNLSWMKAMDQMDSQLREKSIHLLAFISRGPQTIGESQNRSLTWLYPPIRKEVDQPSGIPIIKSKYGWFGAFGFQFDISNTGSTTSSIPHSQIYFSSASAVKIYRIALLLLTFLCMQVKVAVERAQEIGSIDLGRFPELPMPDILHGLQDQAISVVTELCDTQKSVPIQSEIQRICSLLLLMVEKSLYLELCVLQTCGIHPILGRLEDLSKSSKRLFQVAEEHVFLRASLKSLEQIISLLYPTMLSTRGII